MPDLESLEVSSLIEEERQPQDSIVLRDPPNPVTSNKDDGIETPKEPVSPPAQTEIAVPQQGHSQTGEEDSTLKDPEKTSTNAHHGQNQQKMPKLLVLGQVFCLLWCAPIIFALVLNFKAVSVGASVSCIGCYNYRQRFLIQKPQASIADRSVLGALQVVAKVLEVWFVFIAGKMVYELCFREASSQSGLPLGWILSSYKFADLTYYFDKTFFRGLPKRRRRSKDSSTEHHSDRSKVVLGVFLVLLGILANLIGPSIAILIIPQLQWKEVDFQTGPKFLSNQFQEPPDQLTLTGCSLENVQLGNYGCTEREYGAALDSILSTRVFNDARSISYTLPTISQEKAVQFAFNNSAEGFLWAPDRVILSWVTDQVQWLRGSQAHLDAQELEIHGIGQVYGINNRCQLGDASNQTTITGGSIRCFTGLGQMPNPGYSDSPPLLASYDTSKPFNSTVCIPTGNWHFKTSNTTLLLQANGGGLAAGLESAVVNTYTSELGFISTGADFSLSCAERALLNSSSSSCSGLANSTLPPFGIIEYQIPQLANTNQSLWCPWTVTTLFADYVLDPSDPSQLVTVQGLPVNYWPTTSEYMHVDWLSAAWSTRSNDMVPNTRSAAQTIFDTVWKFLDPPPADIAVFDPTDKQLHMSRLQQLILGQAVSLSDYSEISPAPPGTPAAHLETPGALNAWFNIQVYTYGLNSRSSILGTVVAIAALVVVLFHALMFVALSTSRMEPLDFLIMAFRTKPKAGMLSTKELGSTLGKPVIIAISADDGRPDFVFRDEKN